MKMRLAQFMIVALGSVLVSACSDLDYYIQCAQGHFDLMSRTKPIETVLNDPQTGNLERMQLAKVQEIRAYATSELALPDNGSYRSYADIGRQYVVWNVVAAPEFSLEPKQWCFPVAGCVTYRGYFEEGKAKEMADRLHDQGFEVDVYGVQAYSTLNWFDDPVLNTFLGGEEARMAALIFHELAHQQVYVPGDSSFNEAFAKTVELEGLRRWLQNHGTSDDWQNYQARERQSEDFQVFLGQVREQLKKLYAQGLPEDQKRQAKQQILTAALHEYRVLSRQWPVPDSYDQWMAAGLNNARLASVATYRELVPAFQALLQTCQGDMSVFYEKVEQLGQLPQEQRLVELRRFDRHQLLAKRNNSVK